MTAAPEDRDLHRLVDRLTVAQARALRAVALQLVPDADAVAGPAVSEPRSPRRRLSMAGAGHGPPDLAERSSEILRAELGTP